MADMLRVAAGVLRAYLCRDCRLSLGGPLWPYAQSIPEHHLAEELKELKMSAAALARQIEVPTNRVTAILNGHRAVTADTALRLAHFFGTSPEFWLNLQQRYELRLAEQRAGKAIKTLPTLTLPPNLFADS